MAKKKSSVPLADLRQKPPEALTIQDYDALIRTAETHIGLFTRWLDSPEWALTRTRLEARGKKIAYETEGLMRRMCRPLTVQPGAAITPPVTAEQLAYHRGRADENQDLMNFPRLAIAQWTGEIETFKQMQSELRQRQA